RRGPRLTGEPEAAAGCGRRPGDSYTFAIPCLIPPQSFPSDTSSICLVRLGPPLPKRCCCDFRTKTTFSLPCLGPSPIRQRKQPRIEKIRFVLSEFTSPRHAYCIHAATPGRNDWYGKEDRTAPQEEAEAETCNPEQEGRCYTATGGGA